MVKYDRELKVSNGNTLLYKNYEGTDYEVGIRHDDKIDVMYEHIDENLLALLKRYEHKEWRVRIWYGDRTTGRAWNEEYDVTGRIGRSMGSEWKVPLLINNFRSYSGPELLMSSIIRIDDIEDHKTMWKHPLFHVDEYELKHNEAKEGKGGFPWEVWQKNSQIADFQTEEKAKRWIDFMYGKRYCK